MKSNTARILVHGKQSPARNMAVDESLLRLCTCPVLRFYGWNEPAVSIGYFQKTTVVPEGRSFVRRYTGGGLVDHKADFTYTVVLPKAHSLYEAGTARSYELIHAAVAKGLADLGLHADLAPQEMDGNANACFQKPVKYDVVDGSHKLAGAAQRRTREGCLHQGSILVPSPDFDKLRKALEPYLTLVIGPDGVPSELTAEEETRAQELEKNRYSLREWNHSR